MKNSVQHIALAVILLAGGAGAAWIMATPKPAAVDKHGHGDGHGGENHEEGAGGHEGHDHGAGLVKLSGKQLEHAKLGLETAGPGVVRERLTLSGVIQPDLERAVQNLAALSRCGPGRQEASRRRGEEGRNPRRRGERREPEDV